MVTHKAWKKNLLIKYLCPRDFRRGEMEEIMKKVLITGFILLEEKKSIRLMKPLNYYRMKLVVQKLLKKKFLQYFKRVQMQFMKQFKRINQITYYVLAKLVEEVKSHLNGWVLTFEMLELPIMKAISLCRQVL